MMRAAIGVVVAVAIAIVVWWAWPAGDTQATASAGKPAAGSSASAGSAADTPVANTAPPKHVVKLPTAEDRKRVADRIATARANRSAESARTPAPKLPEQGSDEPALDKETIRDAMKEVLAQLAECYESALPRLTRKDFSIKAKMTLTGDPDVGTLIDADQLVDDQGNPLDAKLDDCLRSTFMSLELPPLAEGDQIKVTYPFTFRHRD